MTVQITAGMIKELRDRTGVGMGKCKEALEEAKGDMELAIANLRKAGIASAVKKEGRTTNEGMIAFAENGNVVVLAEANAETDFVVKNDRFKEFLSNITAEALSHKFSSLEQFLNEKYSKDPSLTIDQYRATVVQAIGENIQIKRVLSIPKGNNKSIGIYSHLGGKIVTAVEIEGSNDVEELAKNIGMHVAAASPEYLAPENVPEAIVAQEKEIARSQIKGKPENIIEKILEGKVNSYFDAVCLTRQKYIRDDQLSIEDLVNQEGKKIGKPLKLTRFVRWSVGQ